MFIYMKKKNKKGEDAMKRLSFVLVIVLSFAFVTACQAMGKVDTQKAETKQEVVQDTGTKSIAEPYSGSEEAKAVEESMKTDVGSAEESTAGDIGSAEGAAATEGVAAEAEAIQEAAPTVEKVIADTDTMATTPEKISYLLKQANAFYSSGKFQETVDVAQHILDYLDANSQEAQDVVAMAKEALVGLATKKVEELSTEKVSTTVGDLTSGATEQMGTIGE
jgi:hypothetical protein